MMPDGRGLEFLAAAMALASASVDRLNQIPARLAFLFDYSPQRALGDAGIRSEISSDGARAVVRALAEELAGAPRLDREKYRALANQVKVKTGQKAKALFHPIRIVLTGRAEGPELDLAVPAIDLGADLPESAGIPKVLGNRERAVAFAQALEHTNLESRSPNP
jgi:glutamyl/glutaminyl-tRNA synthetase